MSITKARKKEEREVGRSDVREFGASGVKPIQNTGPDSFNDMLNKTTKEDHWKDHWKVHLEDVVNYLIPYSTLQDRDLLLTKEVRLQHSNSGLCAIFAPRIQHKGRYHQVKIRSKPNPRVSPGYQDLITAPAVS